MKATRFLFLLLLASCASTPQKIVSRIDGPLETRRAKFRQCYLESDSYRREVAEDPRSISLAFSLAPDGSVSDERIVRSDFGDQNLHQCVLWLARETRFDPASNADTIHVLHPLHFRSEQ